MAAAAGHQFGHGEARLIDDFRANQQDLGQDEEDIVDGDVQLTVISGNVAQELDDNRPQEVQNEEEYCTMPLTRIRPLPLLRATSLGTAKLVLSTILEPTSRIWGRTELKDKMDHEQAMIETINFAFPTILTSGTIMAVSGTSYRRF